MLSRFVIAFLPRSKRLLILSLQLLSTVILEPTKIKSVTVSTFSPSLCHDMMGLGAMIFVFWVLSCWDRMLFCPTVSDNFGYLVVSAVLYWSYNFGFNNFDPWNFCPWIFATIACLFVCAQSLSFVQLFAVLWTTPARLLSLSMGFSEQEYWSGLSFPSLGDLPLPLCSWISQCWCVSCIVRYIFLPFHIFVCKDTCEIYKTKY